MIITLSNVKGGTGKTTSAMYLAEAARRAGKDVTVYDTDPQASAAIWAEGATISGDGLAFAVEEANAANLVAKTARAAGSNDVWAVVDCPPSGDIVDAAAEVADLVIVPTSSSSAEYIKTETVMDTLDANGIPYAVLITRARRNTNAYAEVIGLLAERGASYIDTTIPLREAVANAPQCVFGKDLYGYDDAFFEIENALKGE